MNIFKIIAFITLSIMAIACNSKPNDDLAQKNNQTPEVQKPIDYYNIAYELEINKVMVKSDSLGEYLIESAYDPELSPNGKFITITRIPHEYSAKSERYIALINLETKEEKSFGINNNNYYYAAWSPDNQKIAFNVFINDNWQIGIINSDLTGYKLFPSPNKESIMTPIFSEDSKYVFASNNESIIKYDVNGNIVETIPILELIGEDYYLSSATRFFFFDNEVNIVFQCGHKSLLEKVQDDDYAETIYMYNRNTKEISKLLPDDVFSLSINRAGTNKIVYTCINNENQKHEIYLMDIHSLQSKKINEIGYNPSIKYN